MTCTAARSFNAFLVECRAIANVSSHVLKCRKLLIGSRLGKCALKDILL